MNPASARLQAASQSGETLVWYSARFYRPTPFSGVMIMHRQKKWRRPQTAPTDSGRDVGVKTQRNASQSDHSTIFAPFFPRQSSQPNSHQHERGRRNAGGKKKNKKKLCAFRRETSFSEDCTGNGVIIRDCCFSHIHLRCRGSHVSPCYLHTAEIILRVPSPFSCIRIFYTVSVSQCGWREMNKLSIKSEFRARLVTQADRRGTRRRKNVSARTRASGCKWAAIREHLNNL